MRTSVLTALRTIAATAATSVTLALTAPGAGALRADPTPAPVVTDDAVALWPYGAAVVDVLANDVDPGDPDGSQLGFCRVPVLDSLGPVEPGTPVVVGTAGSLFGPSNRLVVATSRKKLSAPVDVDYYVCNYSYLTPATITVTTKEPRPVVVRKVRGKPGRVKVANHNGRSVILLWGSGRSGRLTRVPAHSVRALRPSGPTLRWFAIIGNRTSSGLAGRGVVRGIRVDPTARDEAPRSSSLLADTSSSIAITARRFLG